MNNKIQLINKDCLEYIKTMPDNSVDAIVTDPPAGIGFMGVEWDCFTGKVSKPKKEKNKHPVLGNYSYDWSGNPYSIKTRENFISWLQEIAKECLRVIKPGGHALVWALPKTSHWTATAWENAGWEVRDRIIYLLSQNNLLREFFEGLNDEQKKIFLMLFDESRVEHIFGSGFPKNFNIGKKIKKIRGEKIENPTEFIGVSTQINNTKSIKRYKKCKLCEKPLYGKDYCMCDWRFLKDKEWSGWGTALKPAVEDWWLFRKPLEKGLNVAENVLKWGTGGININECRIGTEEILTHHAPKGTFGGGEPRKSDTNYYVNIGRFPAHIIHDGSEEVVGLFPNNSSRFFYCAKASRKERDIGLKEIKGKGMNFGGKLSGSGKPINIGNVKNNHPTVKPIALMEYLIKLITPPNGVVLDPFMGSGSTGIAAVNLDKGFVGIEKNKEYFEIAKLRIEYAIKQKNGQLF